MHVDTHRHMGIIHCIIQMHTSHYVYTHASHYAYTHVDTHRHMCIIPYIIQMHAYIHTSHYAYTYIHTSRLHIYMHPCISFHINIIANTSLYITHMCIDYIIYHVTTCIYRYVDIATVSLPEFEYCLNHGLWLFLCQFVF